MLMLPAHDGEQFSICISKRIFTPFVDILIPQNRASRASQKGPKVGNQDILQMGSNQSTNGKPGNKNVG
jgi:hypothetical protein